MRRRPAENIATDRTDEPACVTLGHQWAPELTFIEVHVPKRGMRAQPLGFCAPIGAGPTFSVNVAVGCRHCDATLDGVTLICGGLVVDSANPRTLIMEKR